jgi:molybdate transport system ATP-binding protein
MLSVNFKLKRKNFDIAINETFNYGITGIFGPSGSGKTSLMNAISGLAKPQKGEIKIGEHTLFNSAFKLNMPVERRNIGYVFQEGRLFPHMTVEQNLKYGMKKNSRNKLSFYEVVDLLNLADLLNSKPANISGGEKQRTAVGRSLLSSPELLLLDEPFSAMDMDLRSQIIPFLFKIQKRINIPILVVSHDMTDLLKLTSRLCIIKDGKCIGHDDYYNLLRQQEIRNIINTQSLVNSLKLKVNSVDSLDGLLTLSINDAKNTVKIICRHSYQSYKTGEELNVFIQPDDIALSKSRLENVTIQNQLEGKISDIYEYNNSMLCIVDIGLPLMVQITAESLKRMKINIGSKVWCLFKSVAIDIAA